MEPRRHWSPAVLADWAWAHYREVFLAAALLTGFAALAARTLRIDTDLVALLPRENRTVAAFTAVSARFGTGDYLLIRLSAPAGDADRLVTAAGTLARRLQALPEITAVYGWREPRQEEKLRDFFITRALLYLTPAELERLLGMLTPGDAARALTFNRALLALPFGEPARAVETDPFHLFTNFTRVLDELAPVPGLDRSGLLVNPGRTALLLLVRPARPAQDLAFAADLVRTVTALPETPGVSRELGGGYRIALEDSATIRHDIGGTFVLSLLLVLGLCYLTFYSRRALLLGFIPLLVGLVWTAGFCALTVGRVTIVSAAFETILIGLGIDFGAHLFNRYRRGRERGDDPPTAVRRAYADSVPGIVIGALTTAAAFLILLLTGFVGLRELGFLAGGGLLICLGAYLFLFPALVRMIDGKAGRGYRPVRTAGLDGFLAAVTRRARPLLALAAILTLVLGAAARHLVYNDNPAALRPERNRALEEQQAWREEFGLTQRSLPVLVEPRPGGEALAAAAAVSARLAELQRDGAITDQRGVTALVPPLDRQREIMARLAGVEVNALTQAAAGLLRGQGYREEFIESYTGRLRRLLRPPSLIDPQALTGAGLRDYLDRYLDREGTAALAQVWLAPDRLGDPAHLARLEAALAPVGGTLTGLPLVARELNRLARAELLKGTGYAFAVMVGLLWLFHRSGRWMLLNLVPLALAVIWTLGLAALSGIELNIVNICVFPLIIGIAVDNGAHLIHRYRATGDLARTLRGLVRPLVLTATTTVVGFGSLLFADYRALYGMGLLAALGISLSLAASLLVLPALLAVRRWR